MVLFTYFSFLDTNVYVILWDDTFSYTIQEPASMSGILFFFFICYDSQKRRKKNVWKGFKYTKHIILQAERGKVFQFKKFVLPIDRDASDASVSLDSERHRDDIFWMSIWQIKGWQTKLKSVYLSIVWMRLQLGDIKFSLNTSTSRPVPIFRRNNSNAQLYYHQKSYCQRKMHNC